VKLELNEPLANDKFVMEQPAGVQVIHLDQGPAPAKVGGSH
jgi:hypothetical protein